jgi:endonuclease/exonuclease/phosphatase family metal-dependent hydrolase
MIVATYNVHRCVGTDRRRLPSRIAAVLGELGADLIALQEVDALGIRESGDDQFEFFARATGLNAVVGVTIERERGRYGNLLLARHPLRDVTHIDLSLPRREPRGAIEALVDGPSGPLRVIAAHLGLDPRERRVQAQRLGRRIADGGEQIPVVLLGDLNSISATSLAPLRVWMTARPSSRRTYPSRRPILPLDRIWTRPGSLVAELHVHRSPLARIASDHLPLRARLKLDGSRGPPGVLRPVALGLLPPPPPIRPHKR